MTILGNVCHRDTRLFWLHATVPSPGHIKANNCNAQPRTPYTNDDVDGKDKTNPNKTT